MNLYPAHRASPPHGRSITRRKSLAQEIRNELAAYRELAGDQSEALVERRDNRIRRIDAKFAELLALEGFER